MILAESSQSGAESRQSTLSVPAQAVLVLLCLVTWALSHSYAGIFHDAGVYTLQALAHLHPDSLPQDVFLRFGSQDRYTIWSPLFAAAIRVFGAEPAAALLTFALQFAVFLCAWRLARTVGPAWLALLGAAVLVAIPGDYGPDRIFTVVEPFVTPRMAAEALVLASLAAALRARTALALLLLTTAALFHPIMAAAGIAVLLCLYVAIPHLRLGAALFAAAMLVLIAWAHVMPVGSWGRFDDAWLNLVQARSPYLFLSYWQLDDWGRAAVAMATLAVGMATLEQARARTLCAAALAAAAAGLALTLIACDELRLVLLTQLQPWRWQWLAVVTAALLLPQIVHKAWRASSSGRSTALLLIAAWIFASNAFALVAALCAVASIAFTRLKVREARLVFYGTCGMLAIAIIWRLASDLEFTEVHYAESSIPLWTRRAMSFAHDGTAPMVIVLLAFWLARLRHGRAGLITLAILAALAFALLLPVTWDRWTRAQFSTQTVARYAPLRDRIPPAAEVFWADAPVATWLLLDRPSYLSMLQTSGLVFSRAAALEMQRRALALSAAIAPQRFLGWSEASPSLSLTPPSLRRICQTGAFAYLVTGADLQVAPLADLPSESRPGFKALRLYSCPMAPGAVND